MTSQNSPKQIPWVLVLASLYRFFFFNQYNMRFSVLRRIPIHKNRIGFPSTRNPAFKSFPHFLPKALKDTSARLRHPHHCGSSSLSC